MIKVTTTQDVGEVFQRSQAGLERGFRDGILMASEIAAGELRRAVQSDFQQHTGSLGESFRATLIEDRRQKIRAGAFSDLVYARIQDQGGVITPKKARFLTVPLTDQARQVSRSGGSARDLPNTPRRHHWAYVKSVRLAGRHYIRKAVVAAKDEIREAVGDKIAVGVRAAARGD
jgi:hypothetical protein